MWTSLHRFRLVVSIWNSMLRRLLFVSKVVALSVATSGTYYFLENIENFSFKSFQEVSMAIEASFYYNFSIYGIYKVATVFRRTRVLLLPRIDLLFRNFMPHGEAKRLYYVRKSLQCARDAGIYEWHFHRVSRLFMVMYMDTYLQNVINWLIAS